MISKPEAYCPRCKGRLTVLDVIDVGPRAESVTYYCECGCGASDMTLSRGQILSITPRKPIRIPRYEDLPAGSYIGDCFS